MSLQIVGLVVFLFIAVWGFIERRMLVVQLAVLLPTPDLLDAHDEGPGVRFVDD